MSLLCCTHLMTVSLAPEAMAASSSSVMSMARFITVGSLVFRVGALTIEVLEFPREQDIPPSVALASQNDP